MTPLEIFNWWWEQRIPADVLPFIPVVNMQADTNDAPDQWGTALIRPDSRTDVTLGRNPVVLETGAFVIALFTRSGTGAASLDQAVDYMRQAFHGFRYGGLLVLQVDGPHDIEPQGQGEWWQVGITAPYEFTTRRDASKPYYGDWQNFPDMPPPPLPSASFTIGESPIGGPAPIGGPK
jgi:hypothetical protein